MIEHLVWSTATALVAILAVFLLRRRSAALRFNILLIALLRFAIPTPWLTNAGAAMADRVPVPMMADVSQFLRGPSMIIQTDSAEATQPPGRRITPLEVGLVVWGLGTLAACAIFLRRLRIPVQSVRVANAAEREALWHAADSIGLRQRADLRIVAPDLVPGALGFWRPVVVLPDGLSDQLTHAELQAILSHELAHIHRRDNLTAALAYGVVAAFWFHPVVEWLAHRMLTERETACDELVLSQGAQREHYLSGIAKVCQRAIAHSHSYAGITGANLKQRLEHIMSMNSTQPFSRQVQIVPGLLALIAILIPAAGGFLNAQAPTLRASLTTTPAIHVAGSDAAKWFYQLRGADQPPPPPVTPLAARKDIKTLVLEVESEMAMKHSDVAIKLVQTELDEDPGNATLRGMLANLDVRAEYYKDAVGIYNALLAETPTSSDLLFRLGETYRRMGQLDRAIDYFRRASDAKIPPDAAALQQVALILDGTGRRSEAKAAYEKILMLQPDNTVALNNLAYIKAEEGEDLDSAVQMAERASKSMPSSVDVADTLGWAYFKNNQPDQAVVSYSNALLKDFDRATMQGHLAMALEKVASPTPEMKELQVLLRDYPSSTRDGRIRQLLISLQK